MESMQTHLNQVAVVSRPIDATTAKRYPRLNAYLAGLPQGLASYPECTSKASLPLMLIKGMPAPAPRPEDVPEPLATYLARPPSGMWVPEVEAMAVSLAIADHYRMTENQHLQWLKSQNRGFFSSLMYRAVMSFFSPAALIPKGTARWAAVHRGSTLRAEVVGEKDVDVFLDFPPSLFPRVALQQLTAVFEAALENSNARSSEVVLVEAGETRGLFHARWD